MSTSPERAAVTNLLDLDLDGLAAWCASLGQARFRAVQLFRWIHRAGEDDFVRMSDLAKSFRGTLARCAAVQALPVLSEHVSADGTVKWLFDVGGGDAVETVFIPDDDRGTLCVSSQAGCAVGVQVLRDGASGFQQEPENRRDRGPTLVGRASSAPAPFDARRSARHR